MFSRPDGFMLYCVLGVDFFSTSERPSPNSKVRLGLVRDAHNFHMISGNNNVSIEGVDCTLYNQRVDPRTEYHYNERLRLHIHLWSSTTSEL